MYQAVSNRLQFVPIASQIERDRKMIDSFDGEYRWLSNFHPCLVSYEGLIYSSVEAAYQAAKTVDLNARMPFTLYHAGKAKRRGKKLAIRDDWASIKIDVMRELLQQKFSKGDGLAKQLVGTGQTSIVEGNTWGDTFWGMCDGIGENNLGKMIMEIRTDLKASRSPKQ